MKNSFRNILVLAAIVSAFGSAANALPTAEKLHDNFNKCVASDPTWYNRWGYYVASFDRNEAWKICRYYSGDIKMTTCKVNGHWLQAGYYCVWE